MTKGSIWRIPGIPALVGMTFAGFAGYAVLLPVAPLWAVHGGADAAGSGLVNGVLLLFTVLTQLFIPPSLRRFGWGPVMAAGLVLMGVPALLYIVSDDLTWILAWSAVRGIGFGVLTVTGSAAVAELVEPGRRGKAIGTYGLAVALPNLVLLPSGPWVAEHVGFWVIFAISALPLAGIPAALKLAATIHTQPPEVRHIGLAEDDGAGTADGAPAGAGPGEVLGKTSGAPGRGAPRVVAESQSTRTAYLRLIRPMLLLLSVTIAGGAVITFTPQMVSSPLLVTGGLFVMGLIAALSRWQAGTLADRYGAERFIWPLVALTGVGMTLTAWAVTSLEQTPAVLFLTAMVVVGLGYGALQNLTLVVAFDVVARRHRSLASAVWNIGFDAGTALGSVAVGAMAVGSSFPTALLVVAAVSVVALPLAIRRSRV